MVQKKEDNGEAIARNIYEMSNLKVPIISIIIGEGSSGGALALGVGDKIIMLENSVYSILSPEGFASILYKDSSRNKEAAEKMKITAEDLKNLEIIDKIIKEPKEGVKEDSKDVFLDIKIVIKKYLQELSKKDTIKLIQDRYSKYRKIGGIN